MNFYTTNLHLSIKVFGLFDLLLSCKTTASILLSRLFLQAGKNICQPPIVYIVGINYYEQGSLGQYYYVRQEKYLIFHFCYNQQQLHWVQSNFNSIFFLRGC